MMMNKMMKERALTFNEDKTVYIIMGSKRQQGEARELLKADPLVCGNFTTKEVEVDKWLGQQLSSGGLAASVEATVLAREAKVRGAGLEIADIVNDWRARAAGGLGTALLLWETCVIPSLLYGACTWVEMTAATVRRLNNIQRWFARLILQVGPGAPLVALTRETGLLEMGLRVDREKLMFVLHLRSLGEETLARQIYEEQKNKMLPGLAKETEEICKRLNIEDINKTNLSSKDFKVLVTEACKREDEAQHIKQSDNKEKCNNIMKSTHGVQEYFEKSSLKEARETFISRTKLQPFAGNYSKDKRFLKTDWKCRCLLSKEDESHIKDGNCPIYEDIREKYDDLEDDKNLVSFFREVLSRRNALDEEISGDLLVTGVLLADGDPGDLDASQSGGPSPN